MSVKIEAPTAEVIFRSVVLGIEESSLMGFTSYRQGLHPDNDESDIVETKKLLIKEGYKCEFELGSEEDSYGEPYRIPYFVVSWD